MTSPAYWGLRDYGTATWKGGDAECDHQRQSAISRASSTLVGSTATQGGKIAYGAICGKCGARRIDSQLGLEATPAEYVANMVTVFREVRRVLRDDGTLWLNLGDSYVAGGRGGAGSFACERPGWNNQPQEFGKKRGVPGLKPKDLCGIPWRVAFALQSDGWYLRSDIIWAKPNPMPESCTDRPTKAHEYIFLLTRSAQYYYDAEAIKERAKDWGARDRTNWRAKETTPGNPHRGCTNANHAASGRNSRSVWTITTQPYPEAHFATFPIALPERCIKAGTSEKGCCPDCGVPWDRIVERDRRATRPGINNVNDPTGMANRDPLRHVTETKTIGWRSTCIHDSQPVPCTVLDPFSGSGTTGEAACLLGRHYIGIELNPEYAAMSERRIGKALQPDTYRDMDAPEEAPLFQQ